jgi:beta-phosphoglucomutase
MNTLIRPRELIYTDWTLIEPEFDPAKLRARETVFTIGNGYLGTRGSFEEGYPHALPATLVHGVYDDVPGVYTELANCPDWLSLTIVVNGERFRLDRGEILHYERRLDLQHGILSRSIRWRSPIGNTVDLQFDRFVSLADREVLGLRCQITPIDFDGTIEIQSSLNAYPDNQGFDHWEQIDRGKIDRGIWLQLRTRSSQIELGMAANMTAIGTNALSQVTNPLDSPTLTQPDIARSLLTYRYHTLDGARRKAADSGYQGAMFAWESAATGDEMTPRWSILDDPYAEAVRLWSRDREIHISSDIAYAVWQYWQATGDDIWMRDYGAEIILDTARFWMSRVDWNAKHERYEICGAIGADEYHEQVNNNAYPNRLVQWHLEKAIAVYAWLQQHFPARTIELDRSLHPTPARQLRLEATTTQMYIPKDTKTGLIEQFEGFFQLKDINLNDYEPRDRSIQAVLGMDETNQTQVLKQPDVLMLLYLLRDTPECSPEILQTNWDYYAPRTDSTYGSSLCPSIHAILASRLGKSVDAYGDFIQSALVDLEDSRGNTADGIHAASAGGVWHAVVFDFAGIQLTDSVPVANPHLPPNWTRLKFKLNWHGTWHNLDLSPSVAPAPAIEGYIFDVDGVLTHTAEYHYRAWQRLADEEKLPFDRQANEALRGVARRESLMHIVGDRQYSEAALQEMMARKNRYYQESIQSITPQDMFPGAVELLTELRQAGLKIAIGSASKNARTVIEKLGIGNLVDALAKPLGTRIADGDSVTRPKPAPDVFLYAAKQLGLEPSHCVVVEDATVGIEAAIAGGMWSIGIGPITRVGAADIVLPNLIGVHLIDLQTQLSQTFRDPPELRLHQHLDSANSSHQKHAIDNVSLAVEGIT